MQDIQAEAVTQYDTFALRKVLVVSCVLRTLSQAVYGMTVPFLITLILISMVHSNVLINSRVKAHPKVNLNGTPTFCSRAVVSIHTHARFCSFWHVYDVHCDAALP